MRIEIKARGYSLVSVGMILIMAGSYFALQGPKPGSTRPWDLIAFLYGFGAAAIVLDQIARRRYRLLVVDDEGIEQREMFSTRRIAWDRVAYYHYSSIDENGINRGPKGGLVATLVTRAIQDFGNHPHYALLQLFGLDGTKVTLHGYRNIVTNEQLVATFEPLHAQLRLRPRDYAPYRITDTGLSLGDRELPFAMLAGVRIAKGEVEAVARGGATWGTARLNDVRNSMLFVEDLRSRGIRVDLLMNATFPRFELGAPPPTAQPLPAARTVQR